MTAWGHGPAFREHKGTTAEGSRAADRLVQKFDFCTETRRGSLWVGPHDDIEVLVGLSISPRMIED